MKIKLVSLLLLVIATSVYGMNIEILQCRSFWTPDLTKTLFILDDYVGVWNVKEKKIIGGYKTNNDYERNSSHTSFAINSDGTILGLIRKDKTTLDIISLTKQSRLFSPVLPNMQEPIIVWDDESNTFIIAENSSHIHELHYVLFDVRGKENSMHTLTVDYIKERLKDPEDLAAETIKIHDYLQTNNITDVAQLEQFVKEHNSSMQIANISALKIFGISSLVIGGVLAVGGICYWAYQKIKKYKQDKKQKLNKEPNKEIL